MASRIFQGTLLRAVRSSASLQTLQHSETSLLRPLRLPVQQQCSSSLSARFRLGGARGFQTTSCRNEHFLNANTETFRKITSKENTTDKVVLVDFYTDWCPPCKMLSPILEKITSDPETRTGSGLSVDLVTVNTDEETELAMEYEIRSLPTVIAFKDGKNVNKFIGAMPENGVKKFVSDL